MDGWVMPLAALARVERIHALVGVAAAPDFTEDLVWSRLDVAQRGELRETGAARCPRDTERLATRFRFVCSRTAAVIS